MLHRGLPSKQLPMKTSLIISTYNSPAALRLSLKSAIKQRVLPDEIIVADDGSTSITEEVVTEFAAISPVPIVHVWHPDEGFRLCAIRNRAIAVARHEYIIQADGDIIFHKDFVADHKRAAREGTFVCGSRVLLDPILTKKAIDEDRIRFSIFDKGVRHMLNALHLPLLSPLLRNYKRDDDFYLRGCNMAFWRKDLLEVNGYNEDIRGWGREDNEIACRLMNAGVRKAFLKLGGIEYHLYHPVKDTSEEKRNRSLLERTRRERLIRTENGVDKYLC